MKYFAENLRKYRVMKGYTQENIADFLNVTPQSVSKWERGESYPDITFLPALANIFETSVDLLIGMDEIRAAETRLSIHRKANTLKQNGDYAAAEKVYRDALLIYPNKPGMMLGLAGVLALQGKSEEAIELMEKGLPISINEPQKAATRAALCFLYLKCGKAEKAKSLAAKLPHMRESREVIQPILASKPSADEIDEHMRSILLGDHNQIW